jgi:lysyl-tRNA synthetase class 2
MNWWLPHNFEKKRGFLEERARIMGAVRGFFDGQGFTHVETPVMQACPGVDTHIHGFAVEGGQYLQTSPEFAMKKLLVAGMERIYQICPVFRREENTRLHNPEFTMIEWYRAGADYTAIMDDCVELLRFLGVEKFRYNGKECDPHQEWQRLSVEDAFREYAGMELPEDLEAFKAIAPVRVVETDQWDDVFHAIMAEKIEPHLGMGVPTILYDYPASMGALARKKPSDLRWAERFELYVCGVELANAFSELTDAAEQRARIEADMELKRELYGFDYPVDEDFLKALEHGMPEAGGIALGLDRLIMLSCGIDSIDQVLWADRV